MRIKWPSKLFHENWRVIASTLSSEWWYDPNQKPRKYVFEDYVLAYLDNHYEFLEHPKSSKAKSLFLAKMKRHKQAKIFKIEIHPFSYIEVDFSNKSRESLIHELYRGYYVLAVRKGMQSER